MAGERYTRKDAERAFERLCEMLGRKVATSYGDVGGWQLDYNPVYGGFVVHEVSNDGGGVREPFGSQRVSAREFCGRVSFVARALEVRS